jgi:hypothetical protein
MKNAIYVVIVAAAATMPTQFADVPEELRQQNWGIEGSCTHASIVSALRYHGQEEMADWWRVKYRGGETVYGAAWKLTQAGVPFTYTITGDMEWLEWAVRNRMCVILFHVPHYHCVNLVDMTDTTVTLLDNNTPDRYITISRQRFYDIWMWRGYLDTPSKGSAGWAIAICLPPPPPWPDISRVRSQTTPRYPH